MGLHCSRHRSGSAVGDPGNLQLTGAKGGYDACPQYLVTNFIPDGGESGILLQSARADLTLVPCKQDLRQDRTPTCTKAKFDIWNANETKYTGAYRCIKCWYEGLLDEIDTQTPGAGYGGEKFTYPSLKTLVARFRVQGVASSVCKGKFLKPDPLNRGKFLDVCPDGAAPSPLLGVMSYVLPNKNYPRIVAMYETAGAGADGSGFVLWDPQPEVVPEAPER